MDEKKGNILYIDEAQYSKNAGKILKNLVGRAIYFELLPLDFEEFIIWKAKDLLEIYRDYKNSVISFMREEDAVFPEIAYRKEFRNLLEEYVIYGGFPQIV